MGKKSDRQLSTLRRKDRRYNFILIAG